MIRSHLLFMRIGWTQSDSYQYGEVKKIKLFYRLQVFTNKYLKIIVPAS